MKKVGILGGTFNPPHLGHLIIADEVRSGLDLDEIWFMPNQEPPHKQSPEMVTSTHRLEMVRRAVEDNPFFHVQTIELERPGRSYTYDTMKLLTRKYEHEFYFIIGADMVEYLPKWHKIEELLKLVKFVGVNRPHYRQEAPYPILTVNIPNLEVSSLMIRNKLKERESIRYYVPHSVVEYIEENGLYETRKGIGHRKKTIDKAPI
ncbi:nicotinate-nucleotide adenylyltransferase [Bacillus benzoevorans]|uniref:nicotinate-nucleotide adenylyltransferase n=1 Tax=Bacillus benzoevorans TaxID=1456 RepID=UPI0016177BEC|nr:nicotinate-nucleotide adenylyltransferase [Bacillus benzoevorans]